MSRSLSRLISSTSSLALSVAPHGGQRTARRNALSAVRSDEVAARARAEAFAAADAAVADTLTRHLAARDLSEVPNQHAVPSQHVG